MQRTNLTKKDLINSIYMQIGFSKNISENLIDDFLITIVDNLKIEKKLKLSKFGTFSIRAKNSKRSNTTSKIFIHLPSIIKTFKFIKIRW